MTKGTDPSASGIIALWIAALLYASGWVLYFDLKTRSMNTFKFCLEVGCEADRFDIQSPTDSEQAPTPKIQEQARPAGTLKAGWF